MGYKKMFNKKKYIFRRQTNIRIISYIKFNRSIKIIKIIFEFT
jgi:hypothetical protein